MKKTYNDIKIPDKESLSVDAALAAKDLGEATYLAGVAVGIGHWLGIGVNLAINAGASVAIAALAGISAGHQALHKLGERFFPEVSHGNVMERQSFIALCMAKVMEESGVTTEDLLRDPSLHRTLWARARRVATVLKRQEGR